MPPRGLRGRVGMSTSNREPGSSDAFRVSSEAVANLGGGTDREGIVRALRIGLWTWPSFTALDAYMCFVAYPGAPFGLFLAYRIAIELLLLAVYRAAFREDVGVDRLFLWHRVTFCITAFTIALMAIHLGGIQSPYMHGNSIVALVWAAVVPAHWRRGLPTLAMIGLAFPIVMALGGALSPVARAEWFSTSALIVFTSHYVFVVSSCVLAVILSHLVWDAQQKTRKIGSYHLEEPLGRGGMGEVWRARHDLLARRAAIKLIHPQALGGDRKARQAVVDRFQREAQATALLRSPHTIALYDFGLSDKGGFFYVMELLEGYDAQKLVERFGPQSSERVMHLVEQVCDSLSEAHANGLVHRDIKPSNIYVCRMGSHVDFVKVLDFGMVKVPKGERDQMTALTGPHATGTPAYMAPEMIVGSGGVDGRADIYALGCVAYFLLTGRLVFEAETPMRMLVRHVQDEPVPPSKRTELPVTAAIDALVLRCLEKDPLRRPQSAEELQSLLRELPASPSWTRERARDWWNIHRPESQTPIRERR
jgi:serine/threonine-protein kinase